MTERQKEAVLLINRLYQDKQLSNDEYFMLLEYIIPQQQYIPPMIPPYAPTPITYDFGKCTTGEGQPQTGSMQ